MSSSAPLKSHGSELKKLLQKTGGSLKGTPDKLDILLEITERIKLHVENGKRMSLTLDHLDDFLEDEGLSRGSSAKNTIMRVWQLRKRQQARLGTYAGSMGPAYDPDGTQWLTELPSAQISQCFAAVATCPQQSFPRQCNAHVGRQASPTHTFCRGDKVKLVNLNAVDLNGKSAEICEFDDPTGRYRVVIQGVGQRRVKPENMFALAVQNHVARAGNDTNRIASDGLSRGYPQPKTQRPTGSSQINWIPTKFEEQLRRYPNARVEYGGLEEVDMQENLPGSRPRHGTKCCTGDPGLEECYSEAGGLEEVHHGSRPRHGEKSCAQDPGLEECYSEDGGLTEVHTEKSWARCWKKRNWTRRAGRRACADDPGLEEVSGDEEEYAERVRQERLTREAVERRRAEQRREEEEEERRRSRDAEERRRAERFREEEERYRQAEKLLAEQHRQHHAEAAQRLAARRRANEGVHFVVCMDGCESMQPNWESLVRAFKGFIRQRIAASNGKDHVSIEHCMLLHYHVPMDVYIPVKDVDTDNLEMFVNDNLYGTAFLPTLDYARKFFESGDDPKYHGPYWRKCRTDVLLFVSDGRGVDFDEEWERQRGGNVYRDGCQDQYFVDRDAFLEEQYADAMRKLAKKRPNVKCFFIYFGSCGAGPNRKTGRAEKTGYYVLRAMARAVQGGSFHTAINGVQLERKFAEIGAMDL